MLSNVSNNYFDLAYDKDPSDPGYYWGGFVDTKKAWEFAPLNVYAEPLTNRDGVRLNVKDDFKNHVKENFQFYKSLLKRTPNGHPFEISDRLVSDVNEE